MNSNQSIHNEQTIQKSDKQITAPENGTAGLKHWFHDLRSGVMVAMVSLPFSMGIAVTSGAPPICGVVSAIIAGLLLPFLGGSYVTISGPAAGLAPALFAGMISLATAEIGREAAAGMTTQELLTAGYPLVLVAIAIAGVAQVVMARLKIARLSAMFPAAAIEGMLAAIGLLIIVKQLPFILGVEFQEHEFWRMLLEAPSHLGQTYAPAAVTAVVSVAALFLLDALPWRVTKLLPPPVWVFIGGSVLFHCLTLVLVSSTPESQGLAQDALSPTGYCISIPENPLSGVQLPRFDRILTHPRTWGVLAYVVLALLFIDATESLATIIAVDKLDPFKRRSNPDRTLQSMGVCNVASSTLGGLTIIPGIVKSTVNIIGGGRTLWANFYNAVVLLTFLFAARPIINLVPLSVLASILVFVGWKLCAPKVWLSTAAIGIEQLVVFLITLLVTISTDLLVGVAAGVLTKLAIDMSLIGLANRLNGTCSKSILSASVGLFQNPVCKRMFEHEVYELDFCRPVHCFNLFHAIRELQQIPGGTRLLRLRFSPQANVIDHTAMETMRHYLDDCKRRGIELELLNWDNFIPLSNHESAIRISVPPTAGPASSH